MNMTRYKLTGLLAALLLLAGCSQEEETLPNQRNSIVSFLTSTHAPQLISEEAVAESPDENPPFYTAKGNTVYRYISNYYDSGRASRAEVKSGSRVSITFRAYVFSMRNITDSDMPFFTNDPDLEQALYEAGLTPGVWKFEPMELTLGQSGINKRARTGVTWVSPGRRGGVLHDLQHGLRRYELRHHPARERRRHLLHGQRRRLARRTA